MVYPVLTNEEMTTESQRYNCFIRNGGNAIPKHAGPEAKGSNPTTGLTLLWDRNTFRGSFNHWQSLTKRSRTELVSPKTNNKCRTDGRPFLVAVSNITSLGYCETVRHFVSRGGPLV